jgi:polysaccharide biosynthesis protein PslF
MSTSYAVLGTYPPTQCGLATFSAALVNSLRSAEDDISVVAMVDEREHAFPREVVHQWVRGERGGAQGVAARMSRSDVVIVQHEYGIFGGRDGMDVLEAVRAVTVPVIVVFHTVLEAPTLNQRRILVELARICDVVVTMTWTARQRLIEVYGVDPSTVVVIPHGADAMDTGHGGIGEKSPGARPVVLTWGLLGPGKGIEWGIAAMAQLRDLDPAPVYRIVGETHPKVVERAGEAYREGLVDDAARYGVQDSVSFVDRYLTNAELQDIVASADVVLLPYDSRDQVTSGVLVEAITAGKPVISTRFPHAVELLSAGMGILVDRGSADEIADALRVILTQPDEAERMSREAREAADDLLWPAVADRYRALALDLVPAARVPVSA